LAFCTSFFLSVGCGRRRVGHPLPPPPTAVRKWWQDGVPFMGGYVSVVVMTLLAVVNPNKPLLDEGISRGPTLVSKG